MYVAGLTAGIVVFVTGAASSGARPAGDRPRAQAGPIVNVPGKVRPGKRVRVDVSAFPANARVRVQFLRYHNPPCNCDASRVIPNIKRPGFALGPDGARVLRVRMPKRYARCVSVGCSSPRYAPYRKGQPVLVGVGTVPDEAYASDRSRVK